MTDRPSRPNTTRHAAPVAAPTDTTPTAIAWRMVVEPVLALLIAAGDTAGVDVARRAFGAANDTIAIRAFAQLAHSDDVDIDALADEGFRRWKGAPRLVDRWLRAQTGARRSDTIDRVRRLASGPLYDRSDRSRVMAVRGTP